MFIGLIIHKIKKAVSDRVIKSPRATLNTKRLCKRLRVLVDDIIMLYKIPEVL